MPLSSQEILEAALELPEPERFTLVSRLLETMPADDGTLSLDDGGLMEELERRFADSEGAVPWSELRSEG